MKGALARIRRERSLVWLGAMLPHMKKPPSLQDFVGGGRPPVEPASFLDMRLRGSARGIKTITMAEYRNLQRH